MYWLNPNNKGLQPTFHLLAPQYPEDYWTQDYFYQDYEIYLSNIINMVYPNYTTI